VIIPSNILGACLWIGATARKGGLIYIQPAVKIQCYILLISVLNTVFISIIGFNIILGLFGIGYYFMFLFYSLRNKAGEASQEDEESGHVDEEIEEDVPIRKGVIYLVVGAALIFMFSSPFINSVVAFASHLQVNPILLAFFLAPIASEAPEILESISLSRKGNSQSINIAFSNLIGGTITKTSVLCGIFCLYGSLKNFTWESPSYTLCLVLLGLSATVAACFGAMSRTLNKWHGAALFSLFIAIAIIQYVTNTSLDSEVFPDESFAHDDAHSLVNKGISVAQILSD